MRRPDWTHVLVGPVDPRARSEADRLAELPNMVLLGERPSHSMPAYVQSFDVGVVWFQVNEMTEGVTPLKMYEYLAAGVRCVSTPLPAAVGEPTVGTAGNAVEMVAAIEDALSRADQDALISAAASHSWDRRLAPVIERLREAGLDRAR